MSERWKLEYLHRQTGNDVDRLAQFVDDDINSVVALFDDFNGGTHGPAGRFDFAQLTAIKTRVEGAIQFLHRIVVR